MVLMQALLKIECQLFKAEADNQSLRSYAHHRATEIMSFFKNSLNAVSFILTLFLLRVLDVLYFFACLFEPRPGPELPVTESVPLAVGIESTPNSPSLGQLFTS
jgi:hypothetical protein